MNSNLLPCPFCGSTNLRHEFSGSQSYIECNECGTQGPRDEWAADPICDQDAGCAAWNRRAADRAQRQPVPVPPEPGEVQELVSTLMFEADAENPPTDLQWATREQLRRAAELLAQRHPQPVPVSERLPGPEDCDAEGRCWLRRKHQLGGPTWWLARPASIGTEALRIYYAEWLPAHALPLPGEVEG